jgi:hypothetical protein
MSLALARTWIEKMIRQPNARADALGLFQRSAAESVDGTLIVGPRLSTNGKCYLARWDSEEFVVLELDEDVQAAWKVDPKALFRELHGAETSMLDVVTNRLMSISDIRFDSAVHDSWTPLSGRLRIEGPPASRAITNLAVRAKYFRPDLPRSIETMWYPESQAMETSGELRFRFPAAFSEKNPCQLNGPLVVFLQMFAAADWVRVSKCQKVSNVASAIVRIR